MHVDTEAVASWRPFINAVNAGHPGVIRTPPCDGEARDSFELAARYGRVRYSVSHVGEVIAWYDDMHGWVLPEILDIGAEIRLDELNRAQAEFADLIGPHRVLPSRASIGRMPTDTSDHVEIVLVYRTLGDSDRLLGATAMARDGVRSGSPKTNQEQAG